MKDRKRLSELNGLHTRLTLPSWYWKARAAANKWLGECWVVCLTYPMAFDVEESAYLFLRFSESHSNADSKSSL